MIEYIKQKLLNKSSSYTFYKNSYDELVETNRKNTLLLRKNRFIIYYKNQEIIKLKKLHEKISYLESENANLNSKISDYEKTKDMINYFEFQNKQLNDTISYLETENSALNSQMAEYDNIKDERNNLTILNKQLNDTIDSLESDNSALNSRITKYDDITEKISYLESQNEQLNNKLTAINKQNDILLNNNKNYLEKIQYLQKLLEYNNIKLDSQYDKTEFLLTNKDSKLLEKLEYYNKRYLMSIVIPVYNTQNYIEDCFLSILNQSIFNKIEIIFVDDCSTDRSMNKLIELKNNYDNVKIFNTDENSLFGGRPRNKGLEYVTSEYVLFLDSDDELLEGACEILLDKIMEYDADMIFGTQLLKTISNQDNEEYEINHEIMDELIKYYDDSQDLIIEDIKEYPFILKSYSVANKLFNVNFIKENHIRFPEYIPAEDSFFNFAAMVNSKKTVFIPKKIYQYNYIRNSDEDMSVSFKSNQKTRMGRLKSYDMMYKLSKQENIENLFVEYLLCDKIPYMLWVNVFNQQISYEDYVELFNEGYPLFEVLLKYNVCSERYNELFAKIVDKDYDDAIEICKNFY